MSKCELIFTGQSKYYRDKLRISFWNLKIVVPYLCKASIVIDVNKHILRVLVYFRDLLDLAQSIQTLPDLAEISKGASSNSYFLAASESPMLAVEWANKVEVSIIINGK